MSRSVVVRSAISGVLWSLVAVLITMAYWGTRPEYAGQVAWSFRGGILAAPLIGVAMGWCSGWFARAGFVGRAAITLSTLYLSVALFLLSNRIYMLAVTPAPGMSLADLLLGSAAMAFLSLVWSGFFLVLAPLAYVNHMFVARGVRFAAASG